MDIDFICHGCECELAEDEGLEIYEHLYCQPCADDLFDAMVSE